MKWPSRAATERRTMLRSRIDLIVVAPKIRALKRKESQYTAREAQRKLGPTSLMRFGDIAIIRIPWAPCASMGQHSRRDARAREAQTHNDLNVGHQVRAPSKVLREALIHDKRADLAASKSATLNKLGFAVDSPSR